MEINENQTNGTTKLTHGQKGRFSKISPQKMVRYFRVLLHVIESSEGFVDLGTMAKSINNCASSERCRVLREIVL